MARGFTWWVSVLCAGNTACTEELPEEAKTCGAGSFRAPSGETVSGLFPAADGAALALALRLGETSPGRSQCVNVQVQITNLDDTSMLGTGAAWVLANKVDGQWQTDPVRVQFTRPVEELADQDVEVRVQTLGELGGTQIRIDQRLRVAQDDETLPDVSEDCSALLDERTLTLLDDHGEYTTGGSVESVVGFQGSRMIAPAVQVERQENDPEPVCTALRILGFNVHKDGRDPHHIITGPYELSGAGSVMRSGGLFYEVYNLDSGQTLELDAWIMGEGWRAQRGVSVQVNH